jgi:hypothetical protein
MKAAEVAEGNKVLITRRSQIPYVIWPSSNETISLYVTSVAPFLKEFDVQETSRFPNLEFLETDDPNVYFDRRDTGPILSSRLYRRISNCQKAASGSRKRLSHCALIYSPASTRRDEC